MKKLIILITILTSLTAYSYDAETLKALDSANMFFEDLQERKFDSLSQMLTSKSKNKIASDILKAASDEEKLTREKIESDFRSCGEICTSYWTGFLNSFDPADVLERSEWKVKETGSEYIELELQYEEAPNPYLLKMYKQNGKWVFGMTESFWLRNFFN